MPDAAYAQSFVHTTHTHTHTCLGARLCKLRHVLHLLQHHIGLRATSFCCGFCKKRRRKENVFVKSICILCVLQLQQGHASKVSQCECEWSVLNFVAADVNADVDAYGKMLVTVGAIFPSPKRQKCSVIVLLCTHTHTDLCTCVCVCVCCGLRRVESVNQNYEYRRGTGIGSVVAVAHPHRRCRPVG